MPDRNRLPFELAGFESYWTDHIKPHGLIFDMIREGKLPFDTTFRLASIGRGLEDPRDMSDFPSTLRWAIIADAVKHVKNPKSMRPETQQILFGPRPNAIIDDNVGRSPDNREFYTKLDPMYYRMGNLARAIKERRAEYGQTLKPKSNDKWDTYNADELEDGRCFGLARPIWRTIVKRFHPEWLENPEPYYTPTVTMFDVYEVGVRTMRRRIVIRSILSDEIVHSIYQESVSTGVKGIGPVGREDLRRLLVDEHPELNEV